MKKAKFESVAEACHIGRFMHNGEKYDHYLYFREDDRAECLDKDLNIIMTFTANSDVLDCNGNHIGRFRMGNGESWTFIPNDKTIEPVFIGVGIIANMEHKLSKLYLEGKLSGRQETQEA